MCVLRFVRAVVPCRAQTMERKKDGWEVGDGVCEVAKEGGNEVMECWMERGRGGGGCDECVLTV